MLNYKQNQARNGIFFLPLGMRADLNNFLVDLGANTANFRKLVSFFWQKKSEFTKRNFGCGFGIFC